MAVEARTLRDTWGRWVQGLGPWVWWVTLTWRDIEREGTWTKPGLQYCERGWGEFRRYVGSCIGLHNLEWVAGWEWQRDRGVPHLHALVKGVGLAGVRRVDIKEWWWHRYGIARILPYEGSGSAERYMAKYVTKDGLIKLELEVRS